MITYSMISGWDLNKHWLAALPLVRKLVGETGGRTSELAIYESLMRGESQLWLAQDDETGHPVAFITTKTVTYPKIKMLSLEFCSGDGAEVWFPDFEQTLEAYARNTGHAGMEMIGRKGWVRKFGLGWRDIYSLAEKRFDQ